MTTNQKRKTVLGLVGACALLVAAALLLISLANPAAKKTADSIALVHHVQDPPVKDPPSQDPPLAAMRRMFGDDAKPQAEPMTPRFEIPFRPELRRPLRAVLHTYREQRVVPALSAVSFFDNAGRFIGSQSETQITDPMRVTPEQSVRLMRGIGQSIAGVAELPDDFDLSAVWQVIGKRVPLEDIREFSLYAVRYAADDGTERRAVIVKIWGPRNPLGMPDQFTEVHKNRIRFIYYLDDGTWEADNFL